MPLHSSNIPSHIWQQQYVIRTYSYHFLFSEALACHRGVSSCSYCISSQLPNRSTSWHSVAWWDKQRFHTGATLSSKWQYFLLPAWADNWASFVLLSTVRPYLSPIPSDLVIWWWVALWSLELGLRSPVKEFHFSFMLLMGLFITSPQDSANTLLWRVKTHWVHVHLQEQLKHLLTPHKVKQCTASHFAITCPLIIHAFPKLPRLFASCVWWITEHTVGSSGTLAGSSAVITSFRRPVRRSI